MEIASTPTEQNIINKEKNIELTSDKSHKFKITFINEISSLKIKCIYENELKISKSYISNFNLDKIKENKFFLAYESIDEILSDLFKIIDEKMKDLTLLEEANKVNLIIPLPTLKAKEIIFPILEVEKKDNEKISELYEIIYKLEKNLTQDNIIIKELNNKIKNLTEENKTINEKFNKLIDDKEKEINEKLKNLIDENEKEKKVMTEKLKRLEEENSIFKTKSTDENKKINEKLEELINTNEINKKKLDKIEEEKELKRKIKQKYIQNFESEIVNDNKLNNLLKEWINPNSKISAKLLYRLSRDGDSYQTYQQLCLNKAPTLTLAHSIDDKKFGGYTTCSFDDSGQKKKDDYSFLFSLDKKKKYSKRNMNFNSIYCRKGKGPDFKWNFEFDQDNMSMCYCVADTGDNCWYLEKNELADNKNSTVKLKEVEIYYIDFN